MMRVFVVEDEPPALRKVLRLLSSESDVQVCGTAGCCRDAVAGIQRTTPDLVLPDIHLPDGSGFEILQELDGSRRFQTIFLSAFDQYALDAFGVAALDYLVKPVAPDASQRRCSVREKIIGHQSRSSLVISSAFSKKEQGRILLTGPQDRADRCRPRLCTPVQHRGRICVANNDGSTSGATRPGHVRASESKLDHTALLDPSPEA